MEVIVMLSWRSWLDPICHSNVNVILVIWGVGGGGVRSYGPWICHSQGQFDLICNLGISKVPWLSCTRFSLSPIEPHCRQFETDLILISLVSQACQSLREPRTKCICSKNAPHGFSVAPYHREQADLWLQIVMLTSLSRITSIKDTYIWICLVF